MQHILYARFSRRHAMPPGWRSEVFNVDCMMKIVYGFWFFLLALPLSVQAGAIDTLERFLATTKSFQADFSQTTRGPSSKTPQHSQGKVALVKPGKFRWEITEPYVQLAVGDGKQVWLFDPELEQVTRRKMDAALSTSPAALLVGKRDVLRQFDLEEEEPADAEGIKWVRAYPKNKENFERVRVGFHANGQLAGMELLDTFGQTMTFRFYNLRQNPPLPAHLFTFTPPEGVEVIQED
ncbi:MAG: outer membrane lipoprotein chaperone LolA [Zoogloeaceae bacterium]|jgi:outer membrane lipoprotein carrier protein|nr:outer membrane lipoprotein chaperone LolA [Zoogloeaceae bacterium]